MSNKYSTKASKETVEKLIETLAKNNITAYFVPTKEAAKEKALELIPVGSSVMTYTSSTVDDSELGAEINNSTKYNSIRNKLYKLDRVTQKHEQTVLAATPEFGIGSLHAITEAGEILIASMSGSQLPGYAQGAEKLILLAGTQKITKNFSEAYERLNEFVLNLESERVQVAYGIPGSNINKLLVINKEPFPNRTTIIFIDEVVGF